MIPDDNEVAPRASQRSAAPACMHSVVSRDSRCKMITLYPGTAQPNPEVMSWLAREHDGKAGIYGVVLVEGTIWPGDQITLLD